MIDGVEDDVDAGFAMEAAASLLLVLLLRVIGGNSSNSNRSSLRNESRFQ